MPSFAHSEYSDVISEECSWSYIVTIVVIHTYIPFYMQWAKMIWSHMLRCILYRWISGITIWCNTSVAALICIIPLRREPGNLRFTEHKLHVIKQLAHLSLPWSIGWVALSFLVRSFVRPAMVTSPLPLARDPQTHTFSESSWSNDIKTDITKCLMHKYTNTQIQHILKCQEDPTCGIFLKRGLFKDIENHIPIQYNLEHLSFAQLYKV